MFGHRYATRLNSFASRAEQAWPGQTGKPTALQMAERASKAQGLTDVDLNFPDHVDADPAGLARRLSGLGLGVNGLAMRYYTNPAFKLGAFTHPDPAVRREAIDLTKRGIDAARAMGSSLMTIWLGQDGFDYSFQADYGRLWDDEIAALREVAQHDPACMISVEYKPNEPRSFSLLSDLATTLLALSEVGTDNLGVTFDFAHVLYADEMPAYAAAMIARRSRLLGVHLNDGYAKRDDGLMVGSVHLQATLELLWQLEKDAYDGPIYFDTFPDLTGLDPVAECEANIETVQRLIAVARRLAEDNALSTAVAAQDAVASQRIVARALISG
jgi:xylose isomerase